MTARNNRLTQLGHPCHSSPMTTTTNGARLSQYEVRHYATNLSAFAPDATQRQLTEHVTRGDFNNADAERILAVTNHYRRFGLPGAA